VQEYKLSTLIVAQMEIYGIYKTRLLLISL